MSKPFMFIQAPVETRSGYGAHSRDIVHSLIQMDKFEIQIGGLKWGSCPMNALNKNNPKDKLILDRLIKTNLSRKPDVSLEIRIPNEYQCIGKYNIGITAGIETSMVSPKWIEGANKVDLNIVPSNHSKNVFTATSWEKRDDKTQQAVGHLKLTKPMEVLFEGTDTDIYKKTVDIDQVVVDKLSTIDEKFCFLFVGHWLKGNIGQDRKDCGMLLKVFLESFKNLDNPPALIMKTSGAKFCIMDRNDILGKIKAVKESINAEKLPNVYLIHGDLTDEQMNSLYNHPKVKAHVSFTKGEGFGRPLLEASISQKPMLTSAWGGQIDFLDKDLTVLAPGKLTQIDESSAWEDIIMKEAKWFTIDYGFCANVMKDMFLNYRKYASGAVSMGIRNKNDFSLNAMTKKFEEILDKYLPNFSEQIKIDLPKLKKVGNNKESEVKKIPLPKLKKVEKKEEANVTA